MGWAPSKLGAICGAPCPTEAASGAAWDSAFLADPTLGCSETFFSRLWENLGP